MNKKEAEALWTQLSEAFTTIESVLPRIIQSRAWEALGYRTFSEAWEARMGRTRLTTDLARALVAYPLFDEGVPVEKVADTVGTTIAKASRIKEAKDKGLDPTVAQYWVRAHPHPEPSLPRIVRVPLTPDEFKAYQRAAKSEGTTLSEVCASMLRARYGETGF